MAITKQELLLHGLRGAIGKEVMIKQYSDGTLVTACPYTAKQKPSPVQQLRRGVFAEAVAYAKAIVHDRKKTEEWRAGVPGGNKGVYGEAFDSGESVKG